MSNTFFADVKNAMVGGVSITPQTYSTAGAKTGTAVDMQLSDGPVHAVVITGTCGDANTTFVVKLQESDTTTSGDFTDFTSSESTLTYAGTDGSNLFYAVSSNERTKRYVRVVVTIATTGTASTIIAAAVLGRKKIIGGSGTYTTVT